MVNSKRRQEIQEKISAAILGTILPLTATGMIIGVIALFFSQGQHFRILAALLLLGVVLAALWLLRQGKTFLSAHLLTVGIFVIIIAGMTLNGGVFSAGYKGFLILIPLVAWFYGPRMAILAFVTCVAMGGIFLLLDASDLLRDAPAPEPWQIWIFTSIGAILIMGITAIPSFMLYKTLDESERRRLALREAYDREKQAIESLKEHQQALQKLNARYEALFSNAGDGILLLDMDLNIVSVNDTFARIHGYTVEEIKRMGIKGLNPGADDVPPEMLTDLQAGEIQKFEVMHRHRDGHLFPMVVTASLIDTDGDRVIIATHYDLSERKEREDYAALLGRMLDEAPASITVHDREGRFYYANQMTIDLHGYCDINEFMEINLHELDVPESQSLIVERMRAIDENGEMRFESAHYRKDGSILPLAIHARTIEWQGRPALLSIASDISERKRAEEEVKRAHDFVGNVINAIGDPVFVKDEEHRFVLVNDAEVALLGYPREELIGKNDKDFFPKEEVKVFWEGDQQVLASGIENVNEEAITDMRSGETRVIVTRKTRYVDSRGRRFIVGISRDITDRKRSEDAVKRAYDFVENIINAIADPVFVKDEEHRFVLVNDAALALWGYRREELIGKTDTNFFAEDEVKVFWERDHQVLVTGEENINEESITGMRKDETRALITRKTRYVDSVGKRYIVGISSDITERKRAEEALRISEERFRIAAATVSDFIYERDMTTGEAEFFGDMEGCLGYAPGTFPRSLNGWLECIHPDDFAQVLQNLQQAPEHGGKYTLGYRIRRGDGTYANWEETGIILQDSNGTPTKCVGSANDVTARKLAEADREKMEEQLRQAQKMEAVGLLAGGVAHEFNNLLQVILGLVEMVQMDVGVDSSNGRLLEDVNRAGKRAAELTQELLAFSRRQTLMPVNVDLNALVDAEINMLRPLIGANIDVHFIPGAAVNTIRADKRQIEVVLMNLCINARDAMPHGGLLTIETDCAELDALFCSKHEGVSTGTYARLTVTDTGHGMDEAKRAQIFDPFYTTKQVGEGSGLGLATVYGIVTQHKGAIDVASEVGKGTTFSVYLPIAEGAVEEERPRVRRLGPGGTETILVAEDDEMLLSLLEKILTKSGYTVLLARNGEEAVGLFEEHADKIDMALLDVIMPILGGQHVMEKIQAVAPDMKFLFSSGYSENAIQTDFIIKDGLRLIKKPYKSSELLQAVRDTLDALDINA